MKRLPKLLFNDSAAPFVMSALGYSEDKDGFLVDDETKEHAHSFLGEKITIDNLGGMFKDTDGETVFIKGDLTHIIEFYHEELKED